MSQNYISFFLSFSVLKKIKILNISQNELQLHKLHHSNATSFMLNPNSMPTRQPEPRFTSTMAQRRHKRRNHHTSQQKNLHHRPKHVPWSTKPKKPPLSLQ